MPGNKAYEDFMNDVPHEQSDSADDIHPNRIELSHAERMHMHMMANDAVRSIPRYNVEIDVNAPERPPTRVDMVNQPAHYRAGDTYETIRVIEAWRLGFNLGNTVKYISRAGAKGDPVEDLKKARWYLDREIAIREGKV
jgi:hypothetical protein